MPLSSSDVRLNVLVTAPPGSVRDVRAVLEALDRWRVETGLDQVTVARFEDLPDQGSASLRDRLDARVDLGIAIFGRGAGSQGGGRTTEVVDTLHALGKHAVLLRSTESLTDSDRGRLDPGRMALLQRWLARRRDRGLAVHDYRNQAELMDLAVMAAEERVAALEEERPTGPTRQELRAPAGPRPSLRRAAIAAVPGPRPALPPDALDISSPGAPPSAPASHGPPLALLAAAALFLLLAIGVLMGALLGS
ncbi:MAG: hypothetical protein H6732_07125 [Alphaproteobacteria bacterium]|nr:hypothetical protein [Alphaproteobacteria bacterium]